MIAQCIRVNQILIRIPESIYDPPHQLRNSMIVIAARQSAEHPSCFPPWFENFKKDWKQKTTLFESGFLKHEPVEPRPESQVQTRFRNVRNVRPKLSPTVRKHSPRVRLRLEKLGLEQEGLDFDITNMKETLCCE